MIKTCLGECRAFSGSENAFGGSENKKRYAKDENFKVLINFEEKQSRPGCDQISMAKIQFK